MTEQETSWLKDELGKISNSTITEGTEEICLFIRVPVATRKGEVPLEVHFDKNIDLKDNIDHVFETWKELNIKDQVEAQRKTSPENINIIKHEINAQNNQLYVLSKYLQLALEDKLERADTPKKVKQAYSRGI